MTLPVFVCFFVGFFFVVFFVFLFLPLTKVPARVPEVAAVQRPGQTGGGHRPASGQGQQGDLAPGAGHG